jgi:5-methylthioadenosine/S-adenosylhomocysteine deaminase
VKRLIHGSALLTGRTDEPEIAGGGLIEQDGAIVAVGPADELRAEHAPDTELGGADRIVMPGMVDAHLHAFGTSSVLLGIPDRPVEEWVTTMMGLSGPDYYEDALYMAAKLIAGGVTSVLYSHFPHEHDPAAETAPTLRAFADAGMRAACGVGFMDRSRFVNGDDEPFLATLPADLERFARPKLLRQDPDEYVAAVRQMQRDAAGSDRLRILFGPAGPRWNSEDALARIVGALEPGDGLHMHVLDGDDERPFLEGILGRSLFEWFDEIGALTPRTSMTHLLFVDADDMALLAERGVTAVTNTGGNIRLGAGVAPAGAMVVDHGMRIAVGTDDLTIANDDDLLAEVRLTVNMARLEGRWIDPAQAIAIATANGAHAAMLDDVAGTLEPGKRADVVLLDAAALGEPATVSGLPATELVFARGKSDHVREVLIDGRLVYSDGVHHTIDLPALLDELRTVVASDADSDRAVDRRALAQRLADAKRDYLHGAAG